MKKSFKAAAALVLALMLGLAAAAPASAIALFVQQETVAIVPNSPKACENAPGAVVYTEIPTINNTVVQLPDAKPGCNWNWSRPACGDILTGGKYYSLDTGRTCVDSYLKANTCKVSMCPGDRRSFCSGAYYYSTDPEVCYFDYTSDCLVAAKNGCAQVFVYTNGGVPISCLDVDVQKKDAKKCDTLILTPEIWNPCVGGSTGIGVKSCSGKVYDDVAFKIVSGCDHAQVAPKTGKLTLTGQGPVVVNAYCKSNPSVCGSTFVFCGNHTASVYDGCWSSCANGIRVSNWGYDVYDMCGSYGSYVTGWIGAEGCYIPVVRLYDAVDYKADGSKVPTKILTGGTISCLDLLHSAYDDCDYTKSLLSLYNYNRYGRCGAPVYYYYSSLPEYNYDGWVKPSYVYSGCGYGSGSAGYKWYDGCSYSYPSYMCGSFDYRTLLLANILGIVH